MTLDMRNRMIKSFNEDPNVTCFLMSLKAGGVALNLTVASNVMLMDPWWNPAVEQQAQVRPIHSCTGAVCAAVSTCVPFTCIVGDVRVGYGLYMTKLHVLDCGRQLWLSWSVQHFVSPGDGLCSGADALEFVTLFQLTQAPCTALHCPPPPPCLLTVGQAIAYLTYFRGGPVLRPCDPCCCVSPLKTVEARAASPAVCVTFCILRSGRCECEACTGCRTASTGWGSTSRSP